MVDVAASSIGTQSAGNYIPICAPMERGDRPTLPPGKEASARGNEDTGVAVTASYCRNRAHFGLSVKWT